MPSALTRGMTGEASESLYLSFWWRQHNMSTHKTTDTLPAIAMRSSGDFDAMWYDMAQAAPDVWTVAHEAFPALFSVWEPRLDFIEHEDAYLLCAQLPGMQRDDITVECHNGVLTLRGEQSIESVSDQEARRLKHGSRAFARHFILAEPVEDWALAITYTHDGLEVHIPKAVAGFEQSMPAQVA